MERIRKVLGIDPGLATVGYGLLMVSGDEVSVLDFGVIGTDPGMSLAERLLVIYRDLDELLKKFRPEDVYVEDLFFSSNVKTALDVAHARGVLLLAIRNFGIAPQSIKPNQIKLAVTGDGSADKRQVQEMLKRQLDLAEIPHPDDAADALAIALTGALMNRSLA